MADLLTPLARPTQPAEVVIEGISESDWYRVCEMLAQGVKIGPALDDLFIPMASYRLAMSSNTDLRKRIAGARAIWDNRNWPEDLILNIFDRVAGGTSLADTAKELDFKAQEFHALRHRDTYVNESFELALKIQAEGLVDEMREIVDATENDTMLDAQGGHRANGAAPQRDRLRFEMRKWAASKLLRDKYGEKTEIDVNMDVKGNLAERLDAARRRRETAYTQLLEPIDG